MVFSDVLDALENSFQGGLGLLTVAHQHNPLDDVRSFVFADHSEPRGVSDLNLANIANSNRNALLLDDHDVFDILGRLNQSDSTNGEGLVAQGQPLTSDVLVRVGDRRIQLSQRHASRPQMVGIDFNVVLLDLPTEAGHIDYARNLFELALQNPVLCSLQL